MQGPAGNEDGQNGEHCGTATAMEEAKGQQQMEIKRQTRGRRDAIDIIISYENSKRAERGRVGR
jgi:hypothetical protein